MGYRREKREWGGKRKKSRSWEVLNVLCKRKGELDVKHLKKKVGDQLQGGGRLVCQMSGAGGNGAVTGWRILREILVDQ